MWMKIVGCVIFILIFNCYESACDDLKSTKGFNISKNITIHRNGYGRFLSFLSFLKSLHRAKRLHHALRPMTVSKHWRASFEFELKPQSVYPPPNYYYPTQGPVGLTSSIESVFQFGDHPQQVSTSVGEPNKITPQPEDIDIRDELSTEANQPDKEDAIRSVLEIWPKENEIKSERFLRHTALTRTNEADEESNNQSTTTANDAGEVTIQSQLVSTTTEPTIETTQTPPVTTEKPHESETTIHWNNDQVLTTTASIPTEWLGYYDYGAHKPDFIEHIEFTTAFSSQKYVEELPYVNHYAPFRPSLPDYPNSFYSNFFVPMKYFKR